MASRQRIAIDCMGGDFGLRVSLPAALQSLQRFPELELTLVGDARQISPAFSDADPNRVEVVHASDVVTMADPPSVALRRKPDASMRVALDRLHQGEVDAVVSAGNTGALLAIGCYVLGTLPGIDRPAICSALPTRTGHCYMLDLGANVDSAARNLHQFAVMACALAAAVDGNPQPRVALLNIGEEAIKGNERVKLAGKLMEEDDNLHFIGYIEGDRLFTGEADIVVCDGFVGNVALKACEGTARRIGEILRQQFSANWLSRLASLAARPVLQRAYRILDPQQYNGASFLGLQGVVIKSHGNSSVDSFVQAIAQARCEAQYRLPTLIEQRLAAIGDS